MNVLIPNEFQLISSNVQIDEAQNFQHKTYVIGDKVVFDGGVYSRKTATDLYTAFVDNKVYEYGETCSYSSQNYLCKLKQGNSNPTVDTSRWSSVTASAYQLSHSYIVGDLITYDGEDYLCIQAHTSPSSYTVQEWVMWQSSADYAGGLCHYFGNYYSVVFPFAGGSSFGSFVPSFNTAWTRTSITTIFPTESTYWVKVSDISWSDSVFYSVASIIKYGSTYYKCTVAITMSNPSTDTTRWQVANTSLPTNSDDWDYIGATNRYKMFDQYLTTATEKYGDIELSILTNSCNSIFIGNLFTDFVDVEVINNANAETVENVTIDLTTDCTDIFDYFFGDWMNNRVSTLKYARTTIYSDVSINLTFRGDYNRVGIFVIGSSYFIGDEKWEASVEALDFSTVVEDTATGEVFLQQGNELKVKSFDLWVKTKDMYSTDQVLKRARGKPCVYESANENLDTYGFIRKKHEILKNPVKSLITLEVRELL